MSKAVRSRDFEPSRMGLYIMIFGWLTIPVYMLLALEWSSLDRLVDHFISSDPKVIAFRGLLMLLPFIFTIFGYMVRQREKFLGDVVESEAQLETDKLSLVMDYQRLNQKLLKQRKTTASIEAKGETVKTQIKDSHLKARKSMAYISALMEWQAKQNENTDMALALRDDQRRIRAISLVHELAAMSEDPNRICLKDFTKLLAEGLVKEHAALKVQLNLKARSVTLPIEAMVPCALVLNELIVNSLRHAYIGIEAPQLTISVDQGPEGALVVLHDNGIGMPMDLDPEYLNTIGLRIVHKLLKQFNTKLLVDNEGGGTRASFIIPTGNP